MKDDIRAAIRKFKLSKATGPDNISVELSEDCRIDKITTSLNEIYNTSQVPPNIYKFIFI